MVVPLKGNDGGKNTWVFLKPLTWDLWVTIGCFFIFIGFVVWFLEHRINEDFRGPPHHQIGTSFWFAFSTMVFAHRERVVSNLGRFVVIIWCFVVLVLTQSYTASLSSILTIQQLQPIVADVNLLLKNGDNVGYQAHSFIYGILRQLGFQDDKLRTYGSAKELDELLRNGNENGGISAAFDETPYMKLFLATYCLKYTLVEPTFKTDGFAFVFQKGSLLTRAVSTAITQVHEGDQMKAIEDRWFKKTASCSNPNTANSYDTLSLESFWGLFIVAGVASSLALLIFAAMFLYEHSHILTCVDSKASFWTRIRQVLRAYDQQDKTWHAFKKSRKEDGVHGIAAVESTPNTNCLCLRRPSRSSKPNEIEPEIVLEEQQGTTSTQHSDLNPNAVELTSIT